MQLRVNLPDLSYKQVVSNLILPFLVDFKVRTLSRYSDVIKVFVHRNLVVGVCIVIKVFVHRNLVVGVCIAVGLKGVRSTNGRVLEYQGGMGMHIKRCDIVVCRFISRT